MIKIIAILIFLVCITNLSNAIEYKNSDDRVSVRNAKAAGNYGEAIRLLIPFAEKKDVYAQGALGETYYHIKDYKNALKWFKLASKNGDTASYYNLGAMYENGNGVEASFRTAYPYYVKAAKNDNYYALNRLGEIYHTGKEEIRIDKDNAIKCWKKAADNDFIPAMKNMCKYAPMYIMNGNTKLYCQGFE